MTCPDCEHGYRYTPICRGGSDHAGHNCGGRVCGFAEAECQTCDGTGEVNATECSICLREIDRPDPLCRTCERTARAAGRQMAEADRFAREVGHV